MSLYDDLIRCETELDNLDVRLETRRIQRYSPLETPRRSSGVPADILTIGLVGGTGVGKSTIINALAGRDISATSARRPTTSRVIPYIHKDKVSTLGHLEFLTPHLSESVAEHEIDQLRSLIIFDLPDIDSTRSEHADVVSDVLSGLDLVVWVTSITKYSDREFHEWIKLHAAPRNLDNAIFLLNKVDAIQESDAASGSARLKSNFENAIRDSLKDAAAVNGEPRFFTCSAQSPEVPLAGNEFTSFRCEISRERSQQEIQRIKSSDRVALLRNRVEHMTRTIGFEERQKHLRSEVDCVRKQLEALTRQTEVQREVQVRLESSSAPEKAGARLFEQNLSCWPLLPHLRLLSLPLRQAGRLLTGAKLLMPDDEEVDAKGRPFPKLMDGMFAIERERRNEASRTANPILERDREEEHQAIEQRLTELENECVLRIRDGLDAMSDPDEKPLKKGGLYRHLMVWGPLLWFPLVQPLLEEMLRPTANMGTLFHRITFRLARMFGATHLMVSLAFVLLVYLIYILVLRARAHTRAVAQCRKLLSSDWWKDSLLDRLTDHLTSAESHELVRLGEEQAELKTIEKQVVDLEAGLKTA